MGVTTLLNRRLFCSFHTTQAHKSHMSCIKEHLALPPPVKNVNCNKCSEILSVSTPEHRIQSRTKCQSEPKVLHNKKRCCADSECLQPSTHKVMSCDPLANRLDFVGKKSLMSLHTKIDTFRGT